MRRVLILAVVVAAFLQVAAVEPLRVNWWVHRFEDYSGPLTQEEFDVHPGTRLERARVDISVDGGVTMTNIAYGIPVVRGSNTYEYLPPADVDDRAWMISENAYIQVTPLSFLGAFSRGWLFGPMTFYGIWIAPDFVTVRRGMLNVTRLKAAGAGDLVTVGMQTDGEDTFTAVFVGECTPGTNDLYWVCPPDFPLGPATVAVQSLEDEKVVGVRAVTVTD